MSRSCEECWTRSSRDLEQGAGRGGGHVQERQAVRDQQPQGRYRRREGCSGKRRRGDFDFGPGLKLNF